MVEQSVHDEGLGLPLLQAAQENSMGLNRRWLRSLAKAATGFTFAFGVFFGGFAAAWTLVILILFLSEPRGASDFFGFMMSGGHYRVYFAILFVAIVQGAIWFVLILYANSRYEEGKTNGMIDEWMRRLSRSDRDHR